MTERIDVLRTAMSTPLGNTMAAVAGSLEHARNAYSYHPFFVGADYRRQLVATGSKEHHDDLATTLRRLATDTMARLVDELTSLAADTAVKLYLAAPEVESGGLPEPEVTALADDLSTMLTERLPQARTEQPGTSLSGHVAAQHLLREARRDLTTRAVDLAVLVASDSYAPLERLRHFSDRDLLFTSREQPWGFVPGEASCAWLVGRAGALPTPPVASVLGVSVHEARVGEFDDDVTPYGELRDACIEALRECDDGGRVDLWMCDANNSRFRASELLMTAHQLGADYLDSGNEIEMLAPVFGDVGAASPLLQGTAAVWKLSRSGLCKRKALVTTASWHTKERGAIVLGVEAETL